MKSQARLPVLHADGEERSRHQLVRLEEAGPATSRKTSIGRASTSSTDPAGSVLRPGTIEKDRDATSNPSKTKRAAFYGGLGFAMVEGAVRLMFSGPDTEAAILDETRTDKIQQ